MSTYTELYEKAKAVGNVKDVTPTYYEFKAKGDKIIGAFLSISAVRSTLSDGEYNHYLFDTDTGLTKFFLGRAADKEFEPMLKVDAIYCIEFLGKEKISGKRTVNKYSMSVIDDTISN